MRLAVAVTALLAVAGKVRLPRPGDLGWVTAAGLIGLTANQLLLNLGELHVPAGTASVLVTAAPLVSVATARALFGEQITMFTLGSGTITFGGVLMVCLARTGLSAMRTWTPQHSAQQSYKTTHHETTKKRPASVHTLS